MANENDMVEQLCSKLRSYEGEYQLRAFGVINPEDKFLTDKILAAHKREIAAKDAEIEDLKRRIAVYEEVVTENGGRFLKQETEIAKRDALIKELAASLKSYLAGDCIDCRQCAEGDEACDHHKKLGELIAKARRVANV